MDEGSEGSLLRFVKATTSKEERKKEDLEEGNTRKACFLVSSL